MNDHETQDERLHELARRLGVRAAERLDVERTAAAVVRRLREQPAATPAWWVRPAWLRLAAAVVLLLGGAVVYRGAGGGRAGRAEPAVVWLTDEGVSDLSSEQLRALLQSFEQPILPVAQDEGPVSSQEAGLEDLSAGQLRELLHSLEG